MASYDARLAELRAAERRVDEAVSIAKDRDRWRAARRQAAVQLLCDAAGTDLDRLDEGERRVVEWLAETDATSVAAVAALLDRAAGRSTA